LSCLSVSAGAACAGLRAPAILVVDDDPIIRMDVADSLREAGFVVHEAGDGQEALETLAQTEVDLVFSDVQMPRLDGFGLARRLRAQRPRLPIVLASGLVREDGVPEDLAEIGPLLAKPFALDGLIQRIEAALSRP